jgi:hypothetical protein
LGLFAYGLFFKGRPVERWVPLVCMAAPLITYGIRANSEALLFGYKMGFEVLLVVAGLTMVGLRLIDQRRIDDQGSTQPQR